MKLRPRAWLTAGAGTCVLACATPASIEPNTPKYVRELDIPAYNIREDCVKLVPGDRLDFSFESSQPVDFNIHYHDGNAVVMPYSREASRAAADVFRPRIAQDYCLMWEAGKDGALVEYRVHLRRSARY